MSRNQHSATPQAQPTAVGRRWLRTAWIHTWMWVYMCFFVLVLGPWLAIAGATYDSGRTAARRWSRRLYRHFLQTYSRHAGPDHSLTIDPFDFSATGGPCIMVANHQSMLDIVMLMQLPPDARCWAKTWPFKIPLLGPLMKLCGHLLVEDFNILPNAADTILAGGSLYVFPEGTRSRTGRVGRFHDGAFLLSQRTGRPIVPVAIHGTHQCFPPGQMQVYPAHLRVQPLGILWPADFQHAARPHLAMKRAARRLIVQALGEQRAAEQIASAAA